MSQCCHHYILEAPNGPLSLGTCKFCGAQKMHRNSDGDSISFRDHTAGSGPAFASRAALRAAKKKEKA